MLEIIQQNQVKQSFRLGLGVKVADFDMPFWALVGILIKVSLAAIPAGIFLGLVFGPLAVGLLRLFRGY